MSFLASSKPYFWDVDLEKMDVQKNAFFIIERLFEWGDVKEIKWLQKNYSSKLLKNVLEKCRSLSKKSVHFWAMLLSVPEKNLKCIRKQSTKKLVSVWNF